MTLDDQAIPSKVAAPIPQSVLDRVWACLDMSAGPDGCWPCKLALNRHGYGHIKWSNGRANGGSVLAHRAAWTAVHGPIPGALTIDHLCRNRACGNPNHLRLLTRSENSRDNGHNRKTHCPRGHAYDEANTYVDARGHRFCRECNRINGRASDHRRNGRGPIYGRVCAECSGPIAPEKRPNTKYCSLRCRSIVNHRNARARAAA